MKRIISYICLISISTLALTGCGHEHTFAPATCIAAAACTECGETEGEPLGHSWVEADCQTPKTCSVCGETEGEPSGHTTEVGYCDICGDLINQELISMVMDQVQVVDGDVDSIRGAANKLDYNYPAMVHSGYIIMDVLFETANTDMSTLRELCGDYEAFANIKTSVENMQVNIPGKIQSDSAADLKTYTLEYADFLDAHADFLLACANYLSEFLDDRNNE